VRRRLIAANWKMHKRVSEALEFVSAFLPRVKDARSEIALAPPFTALAAVGRALEDSRVQLTAQNVHDEPQGAFTGEVSAPMLADLGCAYGIVGHSERRHVFGERDDFIARKVQALFAHDIRPILCVGETLDEREAGRTFAVLETQLAGSLAKLPAGRATELVVAYEPVWAIGTGRTATPDTAQEAHAMIRAWLREHLGEEAAEAIRIQYGGSVKPDNAAELLARPDVDGALVGGASLDPESFARIALAEETP
jgi:triosephosphate isomerase